MTASRRRTAFALVILSLGLSGCLRAPSPPPTSTPPPPTAVFAVPAPAATAPLAPAPSVTPSVMATAAAGSATAGWQEEANDLLSIDLPPGWRAISLGDADAQTAYESLKQNDARLAGIIGGAAALQDAAFWAFGPEYGEFVDNLNIRRSPLGAQRVVRIQDVVDVLLPEYEKMGLKITSSDAALRVNGFPAARITYTLIMDTVDTMDGKGLEIRGRQVIITTDSDLWILSFSTTPEREAEIAAQFERCAQSFRPK